MIKTRVAKRYARALFELAKEAGKIDEVGRDLEVVDALYTAQGSVLAGLVSPMTSPEQKTALLEAAIDASGIDKMVGNFLRVLMSAGKISVLPQITEEFTALTDEAAGRVRGTATAPKALGEDEMKRLSGALSKALGKEVILEARQDPAIIGGVVARVGNLVFDASVRTQLQRMKESLVKG